MLENKDYYELLEVSKNASLETIKAAYKSMCKKYHPDVSAFDKNTAEVKMKMINEAYAVLSDSSERRQYDREISLASSNDNNGNRQDEKAKAEEQERAREKTKAEERARARTREKARIEAELMQKQNREYRERKILEFKPKPKKRKFKIVLMPLVFVLLSIVASSLLNSYEKSKTNDNGIFDKTYSSSEVDMLYEELKNDKSSLDSTKQHLDLLKSEISDYKVQYESAGGDSLYNIYKNTVEEYNELYNQYSKESNDYNLKVERYNQLIGK